MKRRGFTIIELLVVITMILLLAGLFFAGLQQAREAARRSEDVEVEDTHYDDVARMVRWYPELIPETKKALSDGLLTRSEYDSIKERYEELDEQQKVESLDEDTRKKREKWINYSERLGTE
ncbi:MAG: type II secretion system protein [Candidatus Thorarchaeota archaeon]|jgi:prepilin-type N-terminal cleavage/methylation domain-containing protein